MLLVVVGRVAHYGYSFVLFAPLTIGIVLGLLVRRTESMVIVVAVLTVLGLMVAVVLSGMAGLLCGSIAAAIVVGPFCVGAALGAWRRRYLEGLRPGSSNPAVVLLLVLSPLGTGFVEERLPRSWKPETIATSRLIAGSPEEVWEAVVFFEEVELEPPLFARIGLPRPLRTEGDIGGVGDVKTCTYDTGHLTKRITEHEPGRLLAFDVIERQGIEDRSVDLVSGSFRFEPVGRGATRVTLSTVYRPLLAARSVWRPFEVRLATTLHEHVLDGIEWRLRGADRSVSSGLGDEGSGES